jgi:hypothetical protein
VHYKAERLASIFGYTGPWPPKQKPPEIDPNYGNLAFVHLGNEELSDHTGHMTVRKDDIKKLNLMVGDTLTLRLVRS